MPGWVGPCLTQALVTWNYCAVCSISTGTLRGSSRASVTRTMSRGQTQRPLAHLSYSLAMAFSSDHPVVLSSWSARNSCSMAGPITQWQLLLVWGGSVEGINFGHSVGWNRWILYYHLDEQHWYLQLFLQVRTNTHWNVHVLKLS